MILGQAAVEEVLLLLKVAFLLLLYLFIWRIVRSASRDLRAPQESMVLAPPAPAPSSPSPSPGRLVVVSGPQAEDGRALVLDAASLTIGRGLDNDLVLDQDRFASLVHARVQPRPDGVWIEDAGSTNGTYVNGERLSQPRRLQPGDVIRLGETDLRFER
ncbi:MAG: FHA domain-containing protein [Thermoleophilia bacterium]